MIVKPQIQKQKEELEELFIKQKKEGSKELKANQELEKESKEEKNTKSQSVLEKVECAKDKIKREQQTIDNQIKEKGVDTNKLMQGLEKIMDRGR